MPRCTWTMLPPEVRADVESVFAVHVAQSTSVGHTSADLAEVLELTSGTRVLVKGVRVPTGARNHAGTLLATEARVLPQLPNGVVPGVRFMFDRAGWRLLGTEYIHGRRAVLTPGSRDVEPVAQTLARIAVNPRVAPSAVRTLPNLAYTLACAEPWARLCALEPVGLDAWTREHLGLFADREQVAAALCTGTSLVHTAVSSSELVVVRGEWVTVLDWRRAHLGPPWTDLAVYAAALVEHGHEPAEAEMIVGRNPVWAEAEPGAITAHAVQSYGMWAVRRLVHPHPVHEARAASWRAWAKYRWNHSRARHRRP